MSFKGWDIKRLENWLRQPSRQENEDFDLKVKVPDDEAGKIRLKREFCGFANGKGGFILFGVDDNKRIVGIEKDDELTTKLQRIITTHVTPATIKFEIDECVKLESDVRFVYIVKIHKSPFGKMPHVFYKEGKSDKEDKGLSIPLRINGCLRNLTRGDEIRELCLNQDAFYPQYGIHVIKILEQIKGRSEPYFTLWETTICRGFKNYCRVHMGTEKGNALVLALEDIERKVHNLQMSLSSNILVSTEGSEATDVHDRERLEQTIDSFIGKYQEMFI